MIDGRLCDLEEGFKLPKNIFTFDDRTLSSPQEARTGRRVEFSIPMSTNNDSIVGFATDPYAAEHFNASYHEGVIEVDGVVLLKGVVHLEGIESSSSRRIAYHLCITEGGAEWAKNAAKRRIGQTSIDYSTRLDGAAIDSSWEDSSVVKFLPVYRDEYLSSNDDSSLYTPQRVLSVGDYHPFISVDTLLKAIFEENGYGVCSDFLQGDLMRSLHLSGCINDGSAASATKLQSLMGFKAGRREEATATADYAGRVYLSPLVLAHSLGNFVQTTDKSISEDFYNNGNSLSITEEGLVYRPRTRASVAFDLYLKYKTDCRILTRERLQGFDTIYVDTGCEMHFNIANPYRDHREELVGKMEYLAIIFDFSTGEKYRIKWLTSAGYSYSYISARTAKVTTPSGVTQAQLFKQSATGAWEAYAGDWALYDGYLEENTEHQVEVTLRTPPEMLSPSTPKSFERMYIEGAEPGQSITLSQDCRLEPIFTPSLGFGSQVDKDAILKHNFSQADFIEALQQMFNLRIMTHRASHKVWIEPRDDFYTEECFDWSDRVLLSEPIVAQDMAADVAAIRSLSYRNDGGGAVARFNAANEDSAFGEWRFKTESYVAKDDLEHRANPLFCPTLLATEVVADAPSAALLSVGDRDSDELGESSIRIVSYRGLQALPTGQHWGFPSDGTHYPFAAFHYAVGAKEDQGGALQGNTAAAGPEESFTLCFEDRDGVEGLHRFYDREWQCQQSRRKLTLSIRIRPEELVALGDFDIEGPDYRSLFSFEFCGQRALYRLTAIKEYDAERGVARMTFSREDHD